MSKTIQAPPQEPRRASRRRMSPEVRRRVMSSIRKKDTVPELVLRKAMWRAGIRGWRCHTKMLGSPDVAFRRWRLVVFVDGVWWHGHPDYLPRGRRGPYWDAKIAGNVARDLRVNRELAADGWTVIRLWDLDVIAAPDAAARVLVDALKKLGWVPASS